MPKTTRRIAHVLPWLSVGGVERATHTIAGMLEGEEWQGVAFCLPGADPVREMFADSGFETACYIAPTPSYRNAARYLRASRLLAREFKRQRIDLVHCSDLLAGFYAGLAGRLARVPVLCHIRCSFDNISARDRSSLFAIDKFAFVSRDTWRRFGYRVAPRRGVVVYDGIDVFEPHDDERARTASEVRREFGIPAGSKVVGMVARVAPAKDYRTLAAAARRVVAVSPHVRFLIVGDRSTTPEYREHYAEVRRMLEAEGVGAHFIFTDFRADVARLTQAMDVAVLCTHGEGMPLVVLEAMAYGKPVVATAVGGIPEIIRDGQTGLLHQHEDDAHLAAHLLALLADDARAISIGEDGRAFVRANFGKEKFAAGMMNLYREMLKIAPRGAQGYEVGGAMRHAEGGAVPSLSSPQKWNDEPLGGIQIRK